MSRHTLRLRTLKLAMVLLLVPTGPASAQPQGTDIHFDFETGEEGFRADGLWHRTSFFAASGSFSFYYGRDGEWFEVDDEPYGTLITPAIPIPGPGTNPRLRLSSWADGLPGDLNVDISTDGLNWALVGTIAPTPEWSQALLPFDWYGAGQWAYLRFRFDSQSFEGGKRFGWAVDDVHVLGDPEFAPGTPPPPVVYQAIAGAHPGEIRLTWTPSSHDPLLSLRYLVYRNTIQDYWRATLVAEVAREYQFLDTGLAGGTVYYYWIATVDHRGREGFPTEAFAERAPSSEALPVNPVAPGGGGEPPPESATPVTVRLDDEADGRTRGGVRVDAPDEIAPGWRQDADFDIAAHNNPPKDYQGSIAARTAGDGGPPAQASAAYHPWAFGEVDPVVRQGKVHPQRSQVVLLQPFGFNPIPYTLCPDTCAIPVVPVVVRGGAPADAGVRIG